MKRLIPYILMSFLLAFSISCHKEPVAVTGITLNVSSITLVEDESQMLIATVLPSDADNQSVIWYSEDASVACVNEIGLVEAKKAGQTKVYAITNDGGFTASCNVSVTIRTVNVTGVTVSKTTAELVEGNTMNLYATINPSNATNQNITWSSGNRNIATVDANGKVTAIKAGTTDITVKTEDGGHTASCTLTVTSKPISVTGVALNGSTAELMEGETLILYATVIPSNATNKNVYWSSGNSSVATVDSEGKITAVNAGSTRITVRTEDGGYTAYCTLTVNPKPIAVTGVTLNNSTVELIEGEETTLIATVNPSNATNKSVSWTSSDRNIATVDQHGKVTAIAVGSARITVMTQDGGKTASCTVTVKENTIAVTGVSLNKSSAEMIESETLTLVATVTPSNAKNKNVLWKSSDENIATVDANGKVTAIKAGTTDITVKTEDGGHTASCQVTVKEDGNPKGGNDDFNVDDFDW